MKNYQTKSKIKSHRVLMSCIPGLLTIITILCGIILSSSTIHADTTKTSAVSVTVNTACTITTGGGVYSATIDPGTNKEIAGNGINVSCNDNGGYDLYAVGYSGDSITTPDNNRMLGPNSYYIPTANSGTSSWWAMKAAGSSSSSNTPTIDNSYSSYQIIPATYTRISYYSSVTVGTTNNSVTTPTYKVNLSSNQAAGTYTGKVKYALVHPKDTAAPTGKTIANATTMQDVTECPATLTTGQVYRLQDSRDNQYYLVAKLADGNCWMLQNLKLGRTVTSSNTPLTLTPANSDVGSNYTLNYSDIPANGKFHAYTIDDVTNQNNSTEFYCTGDGSASDWESCYYNWYTATAGTGTTYIATQDTNVDNSICPAHWTLPTGGSNGQFQTLYNQYNSAAQMEVANPTTTKENSPTVGSITNTPGFLLSGYYGAGGASNRGSRGRYWSRTAYSAQNGYLLGLDTSSVLPANRYDKYYGFAVRCVLR